MNAYFYHTTSLLIQIKGTKKYAIQLTQGEGK